jgi:hypothetical protein
VSDPVQQAPAASTSAPGNAPQIDVENPTEEGFQALFDAGAFAPTDETGKTLPPEDQQRLEREAQGATQPDPKAIEPADPNVPPADEGKEYASLDAYLAEQKLDKEAFLELPVTVKIDGKEQSIPLKEAIDGYNLRSVSQARIQQAQEERQQFQAEQTQVRQALGTRIQQAEALFKAALDQHMGDFNQITPQQWQQLRTENPGEYAALTTQFQQRQQALQQLLQQAATARQQEAEQAQKAQLQAIPAEREKLLQARPEWRDPAKFEAARSQIVTAARKLGFSDAELQSLTDHRHLLVLDLAARQLQLQASAPGVLQRVRTAPKMAAPGARQTRDPKRDSYTTARDAFTRDPSNRDAAEAAFQAQWDAA